MIIIGTDNDKKTFTLPREFLTAVSKYFENALKGPFRETNTKTLTLDNVTPNTFRIFHEWLSARQLRSIDGTPYAYTSGRDFLPELLDLYIFADQYDVPQLRRDTMNAWIDVQTKDPNLVSDALVSIAYERLSNQSPMVRFILNSYCNLCAGKWPNLNLGDFPAQFLFDGMKKLLQERQVGVKIRDPYKNRCEYHEHEVENNGKHGPPEPSPPSFGPP
jgi:hypothetical protein